MIPLSLTILGPPAEKDGLLALLVRTGLVRNTPNYPPGSRFHAASRFTPADPQQPQDELTRMLGGSQRLDPKNSDAIFDKLGSAYVIVVSYFL